PLTDFGGKTSIFSHPVYLFLREFSLQDFRGGSVITINDAPALIDLVQQGIGPAKSMGCGLLSLAPL
ncbi:type I-E CRISPR-associated protein Cas6/Cse3/CasE, partial [Escherichia coli]